MSYTRPQSVIRECSLQLPHIVATLQGSDRSRAYARLWSSVGLEDTGMVQSDFRAIYHNLRQLPAQPVFGTLGEELKLDPQERFRKADSCMLNTNNTPQTFNRCQGYAHESLNIGDLPAGAIHEQVDPN